MGMWSSKDFCMYPEKENRPDMHASIVGMLGDY